MDTHKTEKKDGGLPFQTSRILSSNFQSLIQKKSKRTLTSTRNRYLPLSDNSYSNLDDDIGKIVKRKGADRSRTKDKAHEETIEIRPGV